MDPRLDEQRALADDTATTLAAERMAAKKERIEGGSQLPEDIQNVFAKAAEDVTPQIPLITKTPDGFQRWLQAAQDSIRPSENWDSENNAYRLGKVLAMRQHLLRDIFTDQADVEKLAATNGTLIAIFEKLEVPKGSRLHNALLEYRTEPQEAEAYEYNA